jgi:hypothetical protein
MQFRHKIALSNHTITKKRTNVYPLYIYLLLSLFMLAVSLTPLITPRLRRTGESIILFSDVAAVGEDYRMICQKLN